VTEDRVTVPEQPLILIVDDSAESVEVLGKILADICDIQYALSGPEALTLVEKRLPDLILLDVMMPGMDGYQVCEALKRSTRTRDVPVIFVTAKSDPDSELRALGAGAVDFIHKPIIRQLVRARVNLHLALKAREQELHLLNAELAQRVIDRTQVLSDALVRAEGANRAKTVFLAKMSHELRTPMNAILGFAHLLGREVTEPRLVDRVAKIRDAGQRLLGIINDILEVSRLEADKVRIESIDFPLTSVLDATEDAWRERARAKGLKLVREVDPALPAMLRGDPVRLRQILTNFLSNAIKFSERGRITLRAQLLDAAKEDLVVRFEVEDQGIGIGEQEQATMFDSFEQADNSLTRKYGGAGLGLAICKHLTQTMGGKIGVSSTHGQGSRFWITLKLRRSAAAGPQAPVSLAAAAPSDVPPQVHVDWSEARKVADRLVTALANDDMEAQLQWQESAPVIAAVLGARSDAFRKAMGNFEFAAALDELRAAIAACPQLAAPNA
jgi:two-component system, NarL family, sensor histidine kinase BarA